MITTVKAMIDVKDHLNNLLTQAGFADGSKGVVDNKPMFWFINVSTKEGGEKETYLTYNISDSTNKSYGDGEPVSRQIRVDLDLFSRNKKIDDLLMTLNNTFILHGWPFELARIDYDSYNMLYRYSFYTYCVVT